MSFRTLILAGALALPACSKPNDVATLREDAAAIVTYNAPTLELYAKRGDAALGRLRTLPPSQPGYADAMHALEDGRQKWAELKGIGDSVGKQADKETNAASLQKLVEDTDAKYEENLTIIHDDLSAVEAWIARTEDALAHAQTMPAQPAPAAPPEAEPAPVEPSKAKPAEPTKAEPVKTEPKKAEKPEPKTPEPRKAAKPK